MGGGKVSMGGGRFIMDGGRTGGGLVYAPGTAV